MRESSKLTLVVWVLAVPFATAVRQSGSAWQQARAQQAQQAAVTEKDSAFFEEPERDQPAEAMGMPKAKMGVASGAKAMTKDGGPVTHAMRLVHDKDATASPHHYLNRMREAGSALMALSQISGYVSDGFRAVAQTAWPSLGESSTEAASAPALQTRSGDGSALASSREPAVTPTGAAPSAMGNLDNMVVHRHGPATLATSPATKAPKLSTLMLSATKASSLPGEAADAPAPRAARPPPTLEDVERRRVEDDGRERRKLEDAMIREDQRRQQQIEEEMASVRADSWF